jgi:hypothetical protein
MKHTTTTIVATFFLTIYPHAIAQASNKTELTKLLENSLVCKAPPIDAREKSTAEKLHKLGVTVSGANQEGPIDLKYQLPKNTHLFGYPAEAVIYTGDSGSIFYAVLSADPEKIARQFKLTPVPSNKKDYGYGMAKYFKQVKQSSKSNPYPNIVFSGKPSDKTMTGAVLGCEEFDY